MNKAQMQMTIINDQPQDCSTNGLGFMFDPHGGPMNFSDALRIELVKAFLTRSDLFINASVIYDAPYLKTSSTKAQNNG